jgi:signal transduction histidine kinase/DNA-binding response OmpR family regulator/tetratricopeptide (TPR) repeat protein
MKARNYKITFLSAAKIISLIIFIFSAASLYAQQAKIEKLKHAINAAKEDTAKISLLEQLGQAFRDEKKMDSGILTYKQALNLNEKIHYSLPEQRWELACIDYMLYVTGNYSESLKYASKELTLTEKMKDNFHMGYVQLVFGHDYKALGEYRRALNHYFKAKQFFTIYNQSKTEPEVNTYTILCISEVYLRLNQPDSALIFTQQAYKFAIADSAKGTHQGNSIETNYILYSMRIFGDIYLAKGDDKKALNYYRQYISGFIKYKENNRDLGFVFNNMSKIFQKRKQNDSAIFYAKKALANAQEYQDQENIYNAATFLYNFYEDKNDAPAYNKMEKQKVNTQWPFRKRIDSLKNLISNTKKDTGKIILLEVLGQSYRDGKKMDSSILCYQYALEINEKNKYSLQKQCWDMGTIDFIMYEMGNYIESLKLASRELILTEKIKDTFHLGYVHLVFGHDHRELGDYRESLNHYFKAKQIFKLYYQSRNEPENNTYTIQCIGEVYLKMNKIDSALIFTQQAYKLAVAEPESGGLVLLSTRILGDIYLAKDADETALHYYRQYIPDFVKYKENNRDLGFVFNSMSKIFQKRNQNDSAIFYAKKALNNANGYQDQENIYNAAKSLHDFYKDNNEHQAFIYFKIAAAAKDSMASIEKIRQIQTLTFNEQTREKQLSNADAKEAARTRLVIIISSIIGLIFSFLVWTRTRQLRLKHKMILEQKEAEKLRAIDKMKEKFFTNITHELRTPLSLIMSPAEFYLQHPEELNDTPKFLESVYKNSNYLLHLINQLLDISKLDAGKMNISLSKGNFGNYIGDLLKTFEDQAEKKQIELHFENDLYSEYLFDPEQWKRIISNLLSNALKFTPAHGDVSVSVKKVTESKESVDIKLSVRDNGIGINEDQLPFITNRFYQADNNLTRKYEGTGIGLSLVYELVKLMNGTLEISSKEGKGSTFTIRRTLLSAQEADGFPELPALATSIQFSDIGDNGKKVSKNAEENIPLILIAEDNPELNDFLKESLDPFYNVITAPDGAQAFELILSQIPDIIVSDVMMPGMNGFELCEKTKTNPAASHIPFIILSAKTTLESKITGLQKGADDYLTKPFSVDELRSKIKNILDRQEKLRSHYLDQLTSEKPLHAFSEMQNEFLKNTYRIIDDHIDDSQLSVEFLARKMSLNKDVLNRKFSAIIGLSANELIRQYRVKKAEMQHQILELEAKALRSQMNPHFIFNCMNSIKSLIQQKEEDKAVSYLTTFSKLIRTIFQNSDKREITLFDEIETCRLYTQLESMRFGNKFSYSFFIDEAADLKSLLVPALIIQPFIENAIWHGIMPKEDGGYVNVTVKKENENIGCIIDDNGIGREMSKQNKFKGDTSAHQSRGVHLTQSRLDLDNLLNERNASLEITDKKDEQGKANGTMVFLTFKEY